MTHSEADKLWRQLRADGFTVERTNKKHMRITHPRMARTVFAPGSPGDFRSLRNVMGKLRRALKEQPQ